MTRFLLPVFPIAIAAAVIVAGVVYGLGWWTGKAGARVARLIRRTDRAPQDIAQIRAELEPMLDGKPSRQFAFLVEPVWQEFQKKDGALFLGCFERLRGRFGQGALGHLVKRIPRPLQFSVRLTITLLSVAQMGSQFLIYSGEIVPLCLES